MLRAQALRAVALVSVVMLTGCESHGESTDADPDRARGDAVSVDLDDGVERFHVPLTGEEPQRGPDDALVTIVELGDFECPYCEKAAPTLRMLKERYGDDIRLVWINNPLPFHRNARAAATAALEAHAQRGNDAFWTMHDRMFAQQQALTPKDLAVLAADLQLDAEALERAITEDDYAKTVDTQQVLATALNAKGTPTFFINGRLLRGAQPITRFALLIEEELRVARTLVESGIPRASLYAKLIENGIREVEPPPPADAPAPMPSKVYDIPLPERPRAKGPPNAKVVIQEFSDFQCPVCSSVQPILERVEREYAGKVRIVFRDYPLPFHQDAHLAAQAAREVFAQRGNDAFWKYHDMLLQNQRSLDRRDLERYAKSIGGIDMKRFQAALDSKKHEAAVNADIAAIAKAGARIGTPAFFINGRLSIQGRPPFDTFKAAIDAEL